MTRRAVRHSIADRLSGVAAIPVVVLMVGCGDPLPVVEGELAFVGVNVIPMDGPGGTVLLENQTVVVAGRRIASINPTDAVQVGDDVEVTVAFSEGNGIKRLLLSFAPLEKVE